MAFDIPDNPPLPVRNYLPPNVILAETMASAVENDRFNFATRRRLVASIPRFTTAGTVSRAFQFTVKTLPTSSGNIIFVASGAFADIYLTAINAGVTNSISLNSSFATAVGQISGVASDAYETFWVEIQANSVPDLAVVNGIYIFEKRLDSAELPTI